MSTATQTSEALLITRFFDVPKELVWKAFTEPDSLMKWWGPKNFTAPVCKINLHVGGEYLFCMRSPEGKDYWSKGTYREIIPQQRLEMTDSFADEKGDTVPASYYEMPGEWPLELQVTVTFEEQDGKTKMTLRHVGLPVEMKDPCSEGWNQSFDKLEASVR